MKYNIPLIRRNSERLPCKSVLLLISLIFNASAVSSTCTCNECTESILSTLAGDYSCGARIEWLQSSSGGSLSELAACRQVAAEEYPYICGPYCDPDRCNGRGSTPSPVTPYPTQNPPPPGDLYCFPQEAERVSYGGVWNGGFRVEVKEGDTCGPGGNRFTRNTVSVSSDDELTLEFKKVDGAWEASEVRVIMPDLEGGGMKKFQYGEYRFHLKSLAVIDSNTNQIVSTVLPKDLVLGLFTWDPTEKYDEINPQNYMHEVDIEISRWYVDDNEDVQFLMQPPGSPQQYRFFSGSESDPSPSNKYDPSDHWYSFNWLPGGISWSSTAGGGHSHDYTVEDAVIQSRRDYVQCLPANIEIRLNLWNMFGSFRPHGLSEYEYVKVVIDDFQYVESPLRHIEMGAYCSKHCQCIGNCLNGRCESVELTNAPTLSPIDTTTVPSGNPSHAPHGGPCKDSNTRMVQGNKGRGCDWVEERKGIRCKRPAFARHCPKTCNACTKYRCSDTTKQFMLWNKKRKRCSWVKQKRNQRCKRPALRTSCRETCRFCE